MTNIPRPEYPRPQFRRENSWMNLNGEWEFSFDRDTFDMKIMVPYAYQTKLSGINIQDFHDIVWYRKRFVLPTHMKGKRYFSILVLWTMNAMFGLTVNMLPIHR